MAQQANITIKKADGTTDIVFTALSPSAGDKTPAQWRSESVGSIAANKPLLSVTARSTADRKARIVTVNFSYPETYTDSTTGLVKINNTVRASTQFILPLGASDMVVQEAAAQFGNLMDHIDLQTAFKSGIAPT